MSLDTPLQERWVFNIHPQSQALSIRVAIVISTVPPLYFVHTQGTINHSSFAAPHPLYVLLVNAALPQAEPDLPDFSHPRLDAVDIGLSPRSSLMQCVQPVSHENYPNIPLFSSGGSRTTSCLILCHLLLVFRSVHSSPYLPRIASACVFNNRNVGFVKIVFVIISKPRGHLFGTPPSRIGVVISLSSTVCPLRFVCHQECKLPGIARFV